MIALVLAAALIAPPTPGVPSPSAPGGQAAPPPADTAARVPGSWMRLGHTEGQILGRAPFRLAKGATARGVVELQGSTTWVGLPSEAKLHLREDRLERAEFLVENAAPYWLDYVHDQLRLAGYRVRCERDEPASQLCDWNGASHVRLEVKQRRLLVTISATQPAQEALRPGSGSPRVARRDTVPVFPQVFVLGRVAPAGVPAPGLVDSTPLVAPAYPPGAREAGVQGRVWVRALVDTNGAVEATEIVRGIPELDSAAVAVARRCRFRPYVTQGARVRFRVEIPVTFTVR